MYGETREIFSHEFFCLPGTYGTRNLLFGNIFRFRVCASPSLVLLFVHIRMNVCTWHTCLHAHCNSCVCMTSVHMYVCCEIMLSCNIEPVRIKET